MTAACTGLPLADGYTVPPNTDSPFLLGLAIAAAVIVSVLLEARARKKRGEAPPSEKEDGQESADGNKSNKKDDIPQDSD